MSKISVFARAVASSCLSSPADLLERANLLGLDLEHLHQHGPEPAFHRRADLAFLERKGGVGDCPVDHRGLGHRAEVDVLFGLAELLGDLGEALPLAMRSAAACAASALGKSICRMWRRSGVT